MFGARGKSNIALVLFMLAGLVVGFFLGELFLDLSQANSGLSFLKFLGYSKAFGLETVSLNLIVLSLNFGFTVHFSLCGVLCMILAIFIYRRV